ncbi:hypothetical protein SIPHO067v1_p0021 [Vibrio phage 51E28.1]|nr:hypothetical protein SIPHO068v1_p0080 [Vibrio phage 51E28.4]QZI92861.1 hypothetical protein SIPHO067v1_p0021 [Vibrio phage 51E28.1]
MNKVLRMVEGLRDPNQARYYQGDLLPDAADRLLEYYQANEMEEFVEKVQEKLPEVSDFDNLVDQIDAAGDEETVDAMREKLIKISERVQKICDEQRAVIQILIDESEKSDEN